MMFKRHPGLGLIPEWQFSQDPIVNPHINPHVQYPEGMTQQTIQPTGTHWGLGALGFDRLNSSPNYAHGQYRNPRYDRSKNRAYTAAEIAADLTGAFGATMKRGPVRSGCNWNLPCEQNSCCDSLTRLTQLRGLGMENPFESWWWTNRKPLVIGGVAVVGLALLAGLAAVLK